MRLDIALSKTELGRRRLAQPPNRGHRGRRSLLIMMDGRKTLLDLLPAIRSLGLSLADVQAMVDEGLLEPAIQPPDSGAPDTLPVAAPRERRFYVDAAAPAPAEEDPSVGGDTVPMPRVDPEPPAPARVEKWLHVARLFAMDLLTHMVGRSDTEPHERLQRVRSGPGMLAWIEDTTLFIAAAAGPERADRFQAQVAAFVTAAQRGGAGAEPTAQADDQAAGRVPAAGGLRRKPPPQQPTTGPGALLEED